MCPPDNKKNNTQIVIYVRAIVIFGFFSGFLAEHAILGHVVLFNAEVTSVIGEQIF